MRCIRWDDNPYDLDDDIFVQIRFRGPTLNMLMPNLTEIHWAFQTFDTAAQLLPLTGPALNVLHLQASSKFLPPDLDKVFSMVFRELGARAISLTELHIRSWHLLGTSQSSFTSFLCGQTRLEKLLIPQLYLQRSIFFAVQHLPMLKEVNLTNWQPSGTEDLHFALAEGGFPALRTFGWSDDAIDRALTVLRPPLPPHLTSITFASSEGGLAAASLSGFLNAIANGCPQLQTATLNFYQHPTDTLEAINKLCDIGPLFQCRELVSLDVFDNVPMVLNDNDIAKVINAWPRLERLNLTVDPIDESPKFVGNTFSSLSTFAHHAGTTLRHLGLYFTVDSAEQLDDAGTAAFLELQTLSVGTSFAPHSRKILVASYLAGVCPHGFTLQAGGAGDLADPFLAGLSEGCGEAREGQVRAWEEIGAIVKDIQRFQRPARYRQEITTRSLRRTPKNPLQNIGCE